MRTHNPMRENRAQRILRGPSPRASQMCHHRLPGKGRFLNLLPPEHQSRSGQLWVPRELVKDHKLLHRAKMFRKIIILYALAPYTLLSTDSSFMQTTDASSGKAGAAPTPL